MGAKVTATALLLAALCALGVLLGGPAVRDVATTGAVPHPAVVSPRAATVFAAAVLVVLGLVWGSPLLAGPGAATVAVSGTAAQSLAVRRRAGRRRAQVTALVDGISRSVRSGSTVVGALLEVGVDGGVPDLEPDLRRLRAELAAGRSLAVVLDGWSRRSADADLRLLAGTVAVLAAAGGAAGPALDDAARTIRARVAARAEVRALAAQATASAAVLVCAPAAFAVVLAGVDPRLADFLLHRPGGAVCVSLGLVLDGFGLWWMQRIIDGGCP